MTYVSLVRPRWTDMDVYGHVNHAKMVTLLEEARIPLLFEGAVSAGLEQLPKGIVVVKLEVGYKAPIVVTGQELRVDIDLAELKAASFTLAYRVHNELRPRRTRWRSPRRRCWRRTTPSRCGRVGSPRPSRSF